MHEHIISTIDLFISDWYYSFYSLTLVLRFVYRTLCCSLCGSIHYSFNEQRHWATNMDNKHSSIIFYGSCFSSTYVYNFHI